MTRTALLVGGTGPTGPHVVAGLLERGFEVSLFHRGNHESDAIPSEVRHIHGDPHFRETIGEALGAAEFDLVVAAYGRTKLLAEHFRGRTEHFISVGGAPRYAGYYAPETTSPTGVRTPLVENSPLVDQVPESWGRAVAFGHRMLEVEAAVFDNHPTATHFVYPIIYGPRNMVPREWSFLKRARDGRRRILLPDDGLAIHGRGSGRNVAQFLLLAIDEPRAAAGEVFNCADSVQYSLRQWAELVLEAAGASDVELVGVPAAVAPHFASIHLPMPGSLCAHCVFDISKAQRLLGYEDIESPEQAIAQLVDWFGEHPVDRATYPTLVDTFDYRLEDEVIEVWESFLVDAQRRFPGHAEDAHPMAHPKTVGEADGRGR